MLGGAATALAGALALSSTKVVNAATDEPTWDGEADVVVVGFGGAGGPRMASLLGIEGTSKKAYPKFGNVAQFRTCPMSDQQL